MRFGTYYERRANSPKYRNTKCEYDGIVFDSRKEGIRYIELKMLERAGEIQNLELQKVYELIPAQFETVVTGEIYKVGFKKGQPKTKRVCVERRLHIKRILSIQQDLVKLLWKIPKVRQQKQQNIL